MFSFLRSPWLIALISSLAISIACSEDTDRFKKNDSNDILLEPPLIERDDGQLRSEITFDRLNRNRQTSKALTIRQSGVTDLVISRIYIEGAEECDLIKAGLRAGDRLPGELDETCQFMIADGPVNDDGTGHYVNSDNPLVLQEDSFVSYSIKYKATQDLPPSPATIVIESNVIGKERVEVKIQVLQGRPQIAVTPNTIGFPDGMQSSSLLNVRNSGTGQLTITDVQVRRSANSPAPIDPATMTPQIEFRLSPTETPALPWPLDENQSQPVRIEYNPLDDGGDTAELVFISDDPNNPEFSILMTSGDLSSELRIQPNPVIFPAREAAEAVFAAVSFTNNGLKDLAITEVSIEQPGQDYTLGNEQTSFQLQGGQARQVNVSYRPNTVDGTDATLIIMTNADNIEGGQIAIPLRSSASDTIAIDFSPVIADFSSTADGADMTLSVYITNPGGLPLIISRIGLTTEADMGLSPSDPQFSVTGGGAPVTIEPGGNQDVAITFQRGAGDVNQYVGYLIIESNAETSPDIVNLISNPPR